MPSHYSQVPLTFNQTQTDSNVVDRQHFQTPQFPGPNTPSQQFSVQKGAAQLTSKEQEAVNRIVAGMKKRREAVSGPNAFGSAFGF